MMYIFVSSDGMLYNNPDTYIFSKKDQRISWGDKLKVYQVYKKGDPTLRGYQLIYAGFSHEGSYGSAGSTRWYPSKDYLQPWYDGLEMIDSIVDSGKVVYFDLGEDYPKFFKSKEDLGWYIMNIYDIYVPLVNDEIDSE